MPDIDQDIAALQAGHDFVLADVRRSDPGDEAGCRHAARNLVSAGCHLP